MEEYKYEQQHCCHKAKKRGKVETTNELGVPYSFVRVICADPKCGKWISDERYKTMRKKR
jgi:hypothetical protein